MECEPPGVERQVCGPVIHIVNHAERLGFIQHSRLDETTADAQIEEQVVSLGYEFEKYGFVCLSYSTPCNWKING